MASLADPFDVFARVVNRNLDEHEAFTSVLRKKKRLHIDNSYGGVISIKLRDSRLPLGGKYDLLITSPPYGDNVTTVPYGQNAYLPLQWIDLTDITPRLAMSILSSTHEIDARSLGGKRKRGDLAEMYSEVLAQSATLRRIIRQLAHLPRDRSARVLSFAHDLERAVAAASSSVRLNGYMVWTLGNRTVGGVKIRLDHILREFYARHAGTYVTSIRRRIPSKRMANRNSIADTIRSEHVMIFRKAV